MKKTVFVTGAAGFIGFHTALALKRRGDQVVGFDNFNPYYSPELKRRRAALLAEEGIPVIEGDLTDKRALETAFSSEPFTHILHLAAQAGVRHAKKDPDAYVKSNVEGFLRILELCRAHPEVHLTYASSSSVYGANEKIPFAPDDRTDAPTSLYAATKKSNELMAHAYHHVYGIPITGVRYFTAYGPWGRPDMAYYAFTEAILAGKPLPLFNGGHMQRDFTYIDDVVQGTLAALDLGAPWELFNLGNNHPEELLTLISLLEKGLNKKAEIVPLPPQPDEVPRTFADISHSKKRLGFTPTTPLSEGIDHFLKWYQYDRAALM